MRQLGTRFFQVRESQITYVRIADIRRMLLVSGSLWHLRNHISDQLISIHRVIAVLISRASETFNDEIAEGAVPLSKLRALKGQLSSSGCHQAQKLPLRVLQATNFGVYIRTMDGADRTRFAHVHKEDYPA